MGAGFRLITPATLCLSGRIRTTIPECTSVYQCVLSNRLYSISPGKLSATGSGTDLGTPETPHGWGGEAGAPAIRIGSTYQYPHNLGEGPLTASKRSRRPG